jgi:hypothetical protein
MALYRPTDYEIMQYLSHHHYHFSAKTHEATGTTISGKNHGSFRPDTRPKSQEILQQRTIFICNGA